MATVNVLGTEYTIRICHGDAEPRFTDCDGFCDETVHEIFVENYENAAGKPNSKKRLDLQTKKVLRHEIVHAFMFESGLAENSYWAQNEEVIDWIAMQGVKLYKAWQEADAL